MSIHKRFVDLCQILKVENPAFQWEFLSGCLNERGKFYHDELHVSSMLRSYDEHKEELDWPTAVEWAIFWHDAFYNTKLGSPANEIVSANLASEALKKMSKETRERVKSLVMATTHQEDPMTKDGRFLCDFDLEVFSISKMAYMAYADLIRHEYAWVPIDQYRAARCMVLQKFLDRDRIYYTDPYQKREAMARYNLEAEIALLS